MNTVKEKLREYWRWLLAWFLIVLLSVWVGYDFGHAAGEQAGWNAGTSKFKEWFDAEIRIHKKYAEMLDVYLEHLDNKRKMEDPAVIVVPDTLIVKPEVRQSDPPEVLIEPKITQDEEVQSNETDPAGQTPGNG
jgi:hypothetical protein